MDVDMSYDTLRSLPLQLPELRLKTLEAAFNQHGLDAYEKSSVNNAITAIKSVIETKKLRGKMLQATNSKTALSNTYYEMSGEEMMDAYDHYSANQRKLFAKYVKAVQVVKDDPNDTFYDNKHEMSHAKAFDLALEVEGLPKLFTAFKAIEKMPLGRDQDGEKANPRTLEKGVAHYEAEHGSFFSF